MNGRQAWEYHLKRMQEEKEAKKAKEIHDTIVEISKEESWPDILDDHRMHSYAFNDTITFEMFE